MRLGKEVQWYSLAPSATVHTCSSKRALAGEAFIYEYYEYSFVVSGTSSAQLVTKITVVKKMQKILM